MLDALRRGAQGWLAKVLFAILIVSFGIFWNIDDVFRGFGMGSVAKVGPSEISIPEFQRAFQNEISAQSRQLGKRLTIEEARTFGLDRYALTRLVSDTVLDNYASELKLGLSDQSLAEIIQKDENLQGADGKFSKAIYDEFLRQIGMSNQAFEALLRQEELRKQVVSAVTSAVAVPTPLLEAQHAWREEMRKIESFKINPDLVTVADPDEAKLKETYESNKSQFVIPEYRKFGALLLTVDELKKEMSVTDEEAKDVYERSKETYDVPERRRIQQISFKDRAAAEAAKAAIAGGKNFRDVAQEAGASEADINLGLLTQKQLIDKTIGEAAFKLARDEVSDVVQGRFSYVLLRVIEIQPGKQSTFEETKEKIRDKLAAEKAAAEIQKRFDLVEENRNLGKTLKEISEILKINYVEVANSDRNNKTPDGKVALEMPDGPAIVNAAFSAEAGLPLEAIELPVANGYAWVDHQGTTPQKQKTFEESEADVKTTYFAAEKKRLLNELAAKLVSRAGMGEAMDKLASEAGGTLSTTDFVNRRTVAPGLDETAMQQAFALPKGKSGSAATVDGASRVVFRVADIKAAAPATAEELKKLVAEMRQEMQNDLFNAYMAGLQDRQGVSINDAVLKRVTGADAQ
jgi:peptidyl-prolyl cis-trans isomerase D